jgi:pseudouridine-5'-phosphate glycosidase
MNEGLLFDRVSEGATVRTNVALAESNARLASRVAMAYCRGTNAIA